MIRTKKAGRAPDRFGLRTRENMKIILKKPGKYDLYYRLVLMPMIQGFNAGCMGLSTCSLVFAGENESDYV